MLQEFMKMRKKRIGFLFVVVVCVLFGAGLVVADCGDGNCESDENFETCGVDCECLGQGCLEQNVRLKTSYGYVDSTNETDIDELISHGINALIIKNGIDNNVNYTSGDYEDDLPDNVRTFAWLAKEKNVMLFEAFNYYHTVATSTITDNYVVYADGTAGPIVTAFDLVYWEHLTDIAVALANLSINHPNEYRVDGMFLDLEIYGNERGSFSLDWGFEDSTFLVFIDAGGGYV